MTPRLIDYRPPARDRLFAFYAPFGHEMGVDATLDQLYADSVGLQAGYERFATPTPPDGLIARRHPAVRYGDHFYPEPVGYVQFKAMCHKVLELFYDPVSRKLVRQLCKRRGWSWAEDNFEDILHTTCVRLAESAELLESKRTKGTDTERFLLAWRDTLALAEQERESKQSWLIHNPAYNTYRVQKHRDKRERDNREQSDFEPADFVQAAELGELVHLLHGGDYVTFFSSEPCLDDRERIALIAYLSPESTQQQVAEALGTSTASVNRLIKSGIAKLLRKYGPNS